MSARASVLITHRVTVLIVSVLLAAVCGALIPFVGINADMSKYLPTDSPMRAGTEILEEEFADPDLSTFRVAVSGLTSDTAEREALEALEAIPGVDSVTTGINAEFADGDPARFTSGDSTLFIVRVEDEYSSPTSTGVLEALEDLGSGPLATHTVEVSSDNPSTGGELPLWIVGVAILLLSLILVTMCASWIEPLLFLGVIGIAVAINMGSNIVLGEIAEVTASIAAILQLVLSMDYSIILANRYRQEREAQREAGTFSKPGAAAEAMTRALPAAFSAIAAASVTTVVGLVMLVFMSFQVGADLGIVLAKGVALSLATTVLVLPGVLVMCDRLIFATRKPSFHPNLSWLASVQYRGRAVIAVVFLGIFAVSLTLQARTATVYTLDAPDPVAERFVPDNQIVLTYLSENEREIRPLIEHLEADPHLVSLVGYGTTVGEPLTVEQMREALTEDGAGDSLTLDEASLRYLYFTARESDPGTMSLSEFADALDRLAVLRESGELASLTSEHASSLDERHTLRDALNSGRIPEEQASTQLKPGQMAAMLSQQGGAAASKDDLTRLFLLSRAQDEVDDTWRMSLDTFVERLHREDLSASEEAELTKAREQIAEAKDGFVGEEFSRLIITTTYPEESPETLRFIHDMETIADSSLTGEHYLVGNSIMVEEMQGSFGAENLRITILTALAIFTIVALTFRSLAVPALLVLLVQTGVFVTVSVIGLQGYDIFYLAMLVVQCILMGATIDYAIVLTTYYREAREHLGIRDSLARAYDGSIHTILTSGLIMILVTGALGFLFDNPTVGQICRTISLGALAAVLLIVGILPGLLAVTDRFVAPRSAKENGGTEGSATHHAA